MANAILKRRFANTASITFDLHGAKGDAITIKDSGGTVVDTVSFGSGNVSKSVTLAITPNQAYTFVSSVSKDTTSGTSSYSKTVILTNATTRVNCYPDGALYWYGNKITSATINKNTPGNDMVITEETRDYLIQPSSFVLVNSASASLYIYLSGGASGYTKFSVMGHVYGTTSNAQSSYFRSKISSGATGNQIKPTTLNTNVYGKSDVTMTNPSTTTGFTADIQQREQVSYNQFMVYIEAMLLE